MSVRKILLATATLALVTVAGAAGASAASMRGPVLQHAATPSVTAHASVIIHTPAPRIAVTHNRAVRSHIVSDRVVLATLRAHHLTAVGRPQMIRGHLMVKVRAARGRIIMVEVHPITGRLIGVIRI